MSVFFGHTPSGSGTFESPTSLRAAVPASALPSPGTGNVSARTAAGPSTLNPGDRYTYGAKLVAPAWL